MDSRYDEVDDVGEDSGWSLLYAPATSLQPIACAECGNVFAAESAECPWCGRPVGALVAGTRDELELGSSAALLLPAAPAPEPEAGTDEAAADAAALADVGTPGARRWAGVVVAAGVLVAIATGVLVRSGDDAGQTAAPVTTARAAVTSTVATATTVGSSAATTAAPVSTLPATTAPAATTAAPVATSAPATTAAAPTTVARTTIAPTTTAAAGPSLSGVERDALAVVTDLNDAIVAENWSRVRSLAPKNAPTDDVYETYWGPVEAATVVPARVAAKPGGLYDVYVGVVSVTRTNGAVSSSIVCGRYTVAPAARTVDTVVTKQLRTVAGTADAAALANELRTACANPTF